MMIFDNKNLLLLQKAFQDKSASAELSVDLNMTVTEIDLRKMQIKPALLKKALKKERAIFKLHEGELVQLAVFDDGYYQLVSSGEAPTIEIDGIQMHRTKEVKPFEDARQKVSTVIQEGDRVLDTCGGLGYTAIWEIRVGAIDVQSCEPNPNVRWLRMENPWSQEFFCEKITSNNMTAQEYVESVNTKQFDCIIHDPPRFSLAGELYSTEFYQKLYNLLTPSGRMFHYTGNPYSLGRPKQFVEGIIRRLKEIGFKVKRRDDVLGVKAVK